jgi:asparagine synthase (glutamine-hydrolysing)
MCGICGVVQIGGEPREVISPELLDRMTDAMTHRGPNDRGTYQRDGVALGARRLSIVDLEAGHQPFANETGEIWGLQNGELYNHDRLRDELRADGHVFGSRCDTEILPHLYERHGDDMAAQLRGKFAFAVWDGQRRRAVVARDRLGVKPLYWAQVGDLVLFASELKSLLASGMIGSELDYEAIDAYLTLGYFSGPRTPLAGVHKLMPGHQLVIDENGVDDAAYWSYPRPNERNGLSAREWQEAVIDQLEDAVRSRLMSDVPLGAMLSGGLDSSLIVALMARNMSEPVKTFSVGFREDGTKNELSDARLVSNELGTDHFEIELSHAEAVVDLDTLVNQLDEPIADLSALGFTALSHLAAQHVTVALSGQGADELFGGYAKHQAAAAAAVFRRLPAPARALATRVGMRGPARARRIAETLAAPDPVERLLAMSGKLDDGLRRKLLRGPLAEIDGLAARKVLAAAAGDIDSDPLSSTLYMDGQLALVDDMLHYFDRASMAHSLEVRVPFLDHHFVEFAATVPAHLKVHRMRHTKHVLKEAARGLVPDAIIDKPKLGFFAGSVDGWMAAQTERNIADYLLTSNPRYADFLDREAVAELIRRHADGSDRTNGRLLLAILMLEVWLSTFLHYADGTSAPAQPILLRQPAAQLKYAVVSPVKNESEGLPRLAAALAAQTVSPAQWVVVDTGSTDDTREVVRALARQHPWISLVEAPQETVARSYADMDYHGIITRAFEFGVRSLDSLPDVVVKLDADVSFEPDHFERLLGAFAADATLGISSGHCTELENGEWIARHNTGSSVWGAARGYRREILEHVLPLEPSMGWDGIDELKVQLKGWTTRTLRDLPFRHHRPEGARDGNRFTPWTARGRGSHYMGYRSWYVVLRSLHHARKEPHALAMIWGFGAARIARAPVCSDPDVRAMLRRSQTVRGLRSRRSDAIGANA